jgi:hypothetical protein
MIDSNCQPTFNQPTQQNEVRELRGQQREAAVKLEELVVRVQAAGVKAGGALEQVVSFSHLLRYHSTHAT